jgi:tRNA-dihydrouridine synthase 3
MDEAQRQDLLRGKVILAPLTKGGNLPFRRLAVRHGATVTASEMAVARKVVRSARGEMALLRKAPEETCFGVQLAGREPSEMARACEIAATRGASFVDLNLGCPIDLFCRRGMGAALMRRPAKVAALVAAMRGAVDVAVTVKLRLGWDEAKPTFLDVAKAAQDAGADAVTLHGRSRKQRYKRASDWDAVAQLAETLSIPVIGNGDLLTWRDVQRHWKDSGCASVMIGRGALIKPWIFREIAQQRDLLLTPGERVDVLREYRDLAIEHFGDDDHGRVRVREFLVWHLDFFNRYRPVASETFGPDDHPLLQSRLAEPPAAEGWLAWTYSSDPADHERLADRLLGEGREPDADGFSASTDSAILSGP